MHNRVPLFSDWNIQPINLQKSFQIHNKQRSTQEKQALQIIQQSQTLTHNVQSILNQKRYFQQKCNQHYKSTQLSLSKIYRLNKDNSKTQKQQINHIASFKLQLNTLYALLQKGRYLHIRFTQYFQNSNLKNFDSRSQKIVFDLSKQQANIQLNNIIGNIKSLGEKLTRSIHYKENKNKNLQLFSDSKEDFSLCLKDLQTATNHDSLVRLHFLMLFQLQQIQNIQNTFTKNLELIYKQYGKFQLILDCLQLMRIQRQEMEEFKYQMQHQLNTIMENDIKIQKNKLPEPDLMLKNQMEIKKVIKQSQDVQLKIKKLMPFYSSNLQNFKRVAAETSLYTYFQRLTQFEQNLRQFRIFSNKFQKNREAMHKIYQIRLFYIKFIIQKHNQPLDKQTTVLLKKNYDQLLRIQFHQSNKQTRRMQTYHHRIIYQYQSYLQHHALPFQRRAMIKEQVSIYIKKYQDFFHQFNLIPIQKRLNYLRQNKNQVSMMAVQIVQKLRIQKDKQIIQSFQPLKKGLLYCQIASQKYNIRQQLNEMQKLNMIQLLPIQMPSAGQQFILPYIHDLYVINEGRSYTKQSENQYIMQLKNRKKIDQILAKFIRQGKQKKIDKAVEVLIQDMLNKDNQSLVYKQLFQFYQYASRKNNLLIWQQVGRTIEWFANQIQKGLMAQTESLSLRSTQFSVSSFYSFKMLLNIHKLTSGNRRNLNQFRISNLESIIISILDSIQSKGIYQSPQLYFLEMSKLYLLQSYLSRVYGEDDIYRNVRIIRNMMFLQLASYLQLSSYAPKHFDQSLMIKQLIKIQLDIDSLVEQSQQCSTGIGLKVQAIVKGIKKYPLSLGYKGQLDNFVPALTLLHKLKVVKYFTYQVNNRLYQLSQSYIMLQAIRQSKEIQKLNFSPYQNAVVKQKRQIAWQFQSIKGMISNKVSSQGLLGRMFNEKGINLRRAIQSIE